MTTVIRANGVQFINDNLPSLSPVVSDGLVAMFRPSNKPNGLADLYNKDNQLTIVGSPELLSHGAKVSLGSYLQTNTPESSSSTIIAIAQIDNSATTGFIVSNHDSNNKKGQSLYYQTGVIRAQSYSGTADVQNRIFNSGGSAGNNFVFIAMAIDAEQNTMRFINASMGVELFYQETVNYALTNRTLGQHYRIGSAYSSAFTGVALVSEVIIYNKALSNDAIKQQYLYSKEYFKKKHNIEI